MLPQTLLALCDLWLRRIKKQTPVIERVDKQFVVFLDNSFPDFFSQVEYLFAAGFLDGPKVTVVSKLYVRSARSIIRAQKQFGFRVIFFSTLASIPRVPPGAVILYPYNGQANNRMLLNRECVHVFVGHGDSNKKASVNPLLRVYDNVLVTGELAKQRMVDQLILNQHDLPRTISLGTSLIDSRQSARFGYATNRNGGTLVYLPTWEGGVESENYCSIAEANIGTLISGLAIKLGVATVVIDVHPNLGSRRPVYLKKTAELVEALVSAGLKVQIVKAETKTVAVSKLLALIDPKKISVAQDIIATCYGIVDVSAAEGIMAAAGIPSMVAWRTAAAIFPSKVYWNLRNRQVVNLNDRDGIAAHLRHADSAGDKAEQKAFISAMFTYESNSLASATPTAQSAWLHEAVFSAKRSQQPFVVHDSGVRPT